MHGNEPARLARELAEAAQGQSVSPSPLGEKEEGETGCVGGMEEQPSESKRPKGQRGLQGQMGHWDRAWRHTETCSM